MRRAILSQPVHRVEEYEEILRDPDPQDDRGHITQRDYWSIMFVAFICCILAGVLFWAWSHVISTFNAARAGL